jgi:hypothetical protein
MFTKVPCWHLDNNWSLRRIRPAFPEEPSQGSDVTLTGRDFL